MIIKYKTYYPGTQRGWGYIDGVTRLRTRITNLESKRYEYGEESHIQWATGEDWGGEDVSHWLVEARDPAEVGIGLMARAFFWVPKGRSQDEEECAIIATDQIYLMSNNGETIESL